MINPPGRPQGHLQGLFCCDARCLRPMATIGSCSVAWAFGQVARLPFCHRSWSVFQRETHQHTEKRLIFWYRKKGFKMHYHYLPLSTTWYRKMMKNRFQNELPPSSVKGRFLLVVFTTIGCGQAALGRLCWNCSGHSSTRSLGLGCREHPVEWGETYYGYAEDYILQCSHWKTKHLGISMKEILHFLEQSYANLS